MCNIWVYIFSLITDVNIVSFYSFPYSDQNKICKLQCYIWLIIRDLQYKYLTFFLTASTASSVTSSRFIRQYHRSCLMKADILCICLRGGNTMKSNKLRLDSGNYSQSFSDVLAKSRQNTGAYELVQSLSVNKNHNNTTHSLGGFGLSIFKAPFLCYFQLIKYNY